VSPRANDQIDEVVVRKAPIFLGLDSSAADALRASMSLVKLRKGQSLFKEGDDGDNLYVVSNGKVKLGTKSPDGRENLLMILGPGDMFGELSLFDSGPRTATATAVTDSKLLTLAPGRVAKALIDLGVKFGDKRSEGLFVNHDLTQEELAQLVGASRETVNKALADFAQRGWLRLEARSVMILDYERLLKRGR